MFGKKEKLYDCYICGVTFRVPKDALFRIEDLKRVLDKYEYECKVLENKLKEIEPIVESKKLKPAISTNCLDCKFCIRSRHGGDILGCCHDNVCDDYDPKEE